MISASSIQDMSTTSEPTPSRKEQEVEKGRPQIEKEITIAKKTNSRLMKIVSDDHRFYDAIENFLLADPAREIPELGDPSAFVAKADRFRDEGDNMMARVGYETAAKIEIYNQNKQRAEECITLANEVTDPHDKHHEFQRTLLSDMDRVLGVAREYYSGLPTP